MSPLYPCSVPSLESKPAQQLLRALHQVAPHLGVQAVTRLLSPELVLLCKQTCGGTEEELETIVVHTKVLDKLKATGRTYQGEKGIDGKDNSKDNGGE